LDAFIQTQTNMINKYPTGADFEKTIPYFDDLQKAARAIKEIDYEIMIRNEYWNRRVPPFHNPKLDFNGKEATVHALDVLKDLHQQQSETIVKAWKDADL